MDTDSNYFAFTADSIEKIIKPDMIDEYKKDKYNWVPSESNEFHKDFKVDNKPITLKNYEKRTPGLFKVETIKDKSICLCSKMYICSDLSEENIKFSTKGIQKAGNEISFKKFENVLFGDKKDTATNTGFRMINGFMKTYTQERKGLSYAYCKRIVLADGTTTKPLNI